MRRYKIQQPYDPKDGPWVLVRLADGEQFTFPTKGTLFDAYNADLAVRALEREMAQPMQFHSPSRPSAWPTKRLEGAQAQFQAALRAGTHLAG